MARNFETIASIDLGTTRTTCIVSRLAGPEQLEVIGIGSARSEGIRKGVIVNLEALVGSIQVAVEQARSSSEEKIHAAIVTVPAAQARSFTSRGVVAISGRDKIVSQRDLAQVLETVSSVQIPAGQSIIHALPQEYTLDGQDGIQDPVGMTGARLEASAHIVTVPRQTAQHVVSALNRAGVEAVSLVYPQLAAAEAVVSAEEREQGVFLIDCGGGTTDVALFERGALWFTTSVPVAGDLVTNDISIGLRTPVPDAEQIKKLHARAHGIELEDDEDEIIEVPLVGGGAPRLVKTSLLTQIVAPRVQETFELVAARIKSAGLSHRARAGAVLVGGGANLMGIIDTAEAILEMPVRLGIPSQVNGLVEDVRTPGFAVPAGIGLWEVRRGRRERAHKPKPKPVLEPLKKVFRWVGETF